ncbi:hypothetical protein ACFLR2_02645, partial [Chlamydiota bacterium]
GLSEIVKFDELETAGVVDICRGKLSGAPYCRANPQHRLDPSDKDVVREVFENDLLPKMLERRDYHLKFEDFKEFEGSVLESSLIKTIFAESNPEIGRFLHLPEIDPKIVREFDLKIVSDCITKYRKALIQMLDVEAIHVALAEIGEKAAEQRVKEIKDKILRLQKYIMDMSGVQVLNNPGNMQEKWAKLRADFASIVVDTEVTPSWLDMLRPTQLLRYGIDVLIGRKAREQQQRINELLEQCSKDLDQRYETLLSLKEIEMVIQKQGVIEQTFNFEPISTQSIDAAIQSIQQKIAALRTVYGTGEWDQRVEFMASHLTSSLPPASNPQMAHLLLYACLGPSHIVTRLSEVRVKPLSPLAEAMIRITKKDSVSSLFGVNATTLMILAYMSLKTDSPDAKAAMLALQQLPPDTEGVPVWVSTVMKELTLVTKATEIVNTLTEGESIEVAEDDADKKLICKMATAAVEAIQLQRPVQEEDNAAFAEFYMEAVEAALWSFMFALSDYMRKADDTMGSEAKNAIAALRQMMKIYKCDTLKILDFLDLFYKNHPLSRTLCAAAILKALERSEGAEFDL